MYLKLKVGALMKERGISEKEMWERTKLARNTIRSLMRGSNTRVDLSVLERVAAELDVRPMELFEEVETKPGPWAPARLAPQLG
jgi:putative transcriptional regulator